MAVVLLVPSALDLAALTERCEPPFALTLARIFAKAFGDGRGVGTSPLLVAERALVGVSGF